MKFSDKFWVTLFAVGVICYIVWEQYDVVIPALFVVGAASLALALANRLTDGKIWSRNDQGIKTEGRLLTAAFIALLAGSFFSAMGRQDVGEFGGQVIVILVLLAIFAQVVMPKSGKSKS